MLLQESISFKYDAGLEHEQGETFLGPLMVAYEEVDLVEAGLNPCAPLMVDLTGARQRFYG